MSAALPGHTAPLLTALCLLLTLACTPTDQAEDSDSPQATRGEGQAAGEPGPDAGGSAMPPSGDTEPGPAPSGQVEAGEAGGDTTPDGAGGDTTPDGAATEGDGSDSTPTDGDSGDAMVDQGSGTVEPDPVEPGGNVETDPDTSCTTGGCSGQFCIETSAGGIGGICDFRDEYACYRDAECTRQPDGACGWTPTDSLQACIDEARGGGTGTTPTAGLSWYQTCGDPVCRGDALHDLPGVANCSADQLEGTGCDLQGERCDGVLGCGASLVCADRDPRQQQGGCPISRARYKRDIHYLDEAQRGAFAAQLRDMKLATYRYKQDPSGTPQLGFIIEDLEPSVAVQGDQVNLYGYLSMAVATLQVQAREIAALRAELEHLKQGGARQPASPAGR